ncbi:DUF2339 domain-containing protein [Gordonia polyisoprenivorans]|uniref:DUF2339 domain-containing protein n=1 Tax=Gordonia polyisoprenivorans TaxID=84595 RepID=UPI0023017C2D|nr:DUF2339 domain-containing protein [Gordonia polyisoprenivorans]WCB37090.1 DUF2339 domain-containing protein [Gordonia polyisoprenivorans]
MNHTPAPGGPTPAPSDTTVTVLERISGQFADIARSMTSISDDMTTLQSILGAAPVPPQPSPQPVPPQAVPPSPHQHQPMPAPYAIPTYQPVRPAPNAMPAGPMPVGPMPVGPIPPRPSYPPAGHRPPIPPRKTMSERISQAAERGLVGKLLATAGVGITLIGVVLLLVLAAQAGLLRPELRVAGGALLAVALVGVGAVLGRDARRRSGAAALVATGVATALFDVLAITAIYHWVPDYAALILAAVIAAGGLGIAHWWDSQALALMVGIPLVVFAPFITGEIDDVLVGFLLGYTAATLWIQLGRNWIAMFATNTAVATLPLCYAVVEGMLTSPDAVQWFVVIALGLNMLLATGSALVLLRSSTQPLIVTLVASATLVPMLGAAPVAGPMVASIMLALTAVVLATLALGTDHLRGVTSAVRTVWLAAGAVATCGALMAGLDGPGLVIGLAGVGFVVAVGACVTNQLALQLRIVGTVFTGLALLGSMSLGAIDRMVLRNSLSATTQAQLVIVAAVSLAAVATLTWSWARVRRSDVPTIGSLISLGLVTEICVGLGGAISGGADSGFRAGHTVATITWVLTAAAGLIWARRLHGSSRTLTVTVSLVIVAAAVAKLFLFDLAALDGLFRVIAFIVVGLLLLTLGVVYAQSLNSDDGRAHPRTP